MFILKYRIQSKIRHCIQLCLVNILYPNTGVFMPFCFLFQCHHFLKKSRPCLYLSNCFFILQIKHFLMRVPQRCSSLGSYQVILGVCLIIGDAKFYHLVKLPSDFPGGSDGKVSVYNAGDLGSMPGSGRFPGEGNPFQYSCTENPMDGGA